MKIIKHSREAHAIVPAPAGTSNATVSFSPAVGQLLGIDSNGTLEVSNVFALPSGSLGGASGEGEGETRGVKAGTFLSSHSSRTQADDGIPQRPSTLRSSSPVLRTSTRTPPWSASTPRPTTDSTSP